MSDTHRLKRDLTPITEGDKAFREKFISWNMAHLTAYDIREYLKEKDMILVPVASVEQHGDHLPLWTDTASINEITERAAHLAGVLHTPPVWTGYSPHHMHEPNGGRGTITLRSSTFLNLINDVGRSLIHHGFNRSIFMNGHGSNNKVIDPVLRKLRYDTGALISFVNRTWKTMSVLWRG